MSKHSRSTITSCQLLIFFSIFTVLLVSEPEFQPFSLLFIIWQMQWGTTGVQPYIFCPDIHRTMPTEIFLNLYTLVFLVWLTLILCLGTRVLHKMICVTCHSFANECLEYVMCVSKTSFATLEEGYLAMIFSSEMLILRLLTNCEKATLQSTSNECLKLSALSTAS